VHSGGLNIPQLLAHVAEVGSVEGFPGAEAFVPREDFWGIDCDILIPAALEQQITAERAQVIRAKIILEGANGPTLPAADDILTDRGVLIVPDVLANAGGVTVSYFEWAQNFSSFFWTEEEINSRLTRIMREAFDAVWQVSQEKKVSMRTATFILACTRVLQAREVRGLYP
jgi:glutamate dehydrogenase (NAD(P)+)